MARRYCTAGGGARGPPARSSQQPLAGAGGWARGKGEGPPAPTRGAPSEAPRRESFGMADSRGFNPWWSSARVGLWGVEGLGETPGRSVRCCKFGGKACVRGGRAAGHSALLALLELGFWARPPSQSDCGCGKESVSHNRACQLDTCVEQTNVSKAQKAHLSIL